MTNEARVVLSRTVLSSRGREKIPTLVRLARVFSSCGPEVIVAGNADDPVVITTDDLRERCREVAKKNEQQTDFPRSLSTRKLFNTIKNSFKTSSEHAAPEMPDKAAQVFGTTEKQQARIILPPAIRSSRVLDTQPGESSRSTVPPTPPAKDTPPRAADAPPAVLGDTRAPSAGPRTLLDEGRVWFRTGPYASADMAPLVKGSPLVWPSARGEQQTEHGDHHAPANGKGKGKQREEENARPSAVKEELLQPRFYSPPGHTAASFAPGESPSRNVSDPICHSVTHTHSLSFTLSLLHSFTPLSHSLTHTHTHSLTHSLSLSHTHTLSHSLSLSLSLTFLTSGAACNALASTPAAFCPVPTPLSLHAYTPANCINHQSDATRMLFAAPSRVRPPSPSHDSTKSSSKEGSIPIMFVGNPNEIDPGSSTAQLIADAERNAASAHGRDGAAITTRVMQALRLQEHAAEGPPASSTPAQANPSSSRLTDMLRDTHPPPHGWNRDFRPNCPSAVPSPLARIPASPLTPGQSAMTSPVAGAPFPPRTNRTMEEHFFMTNEHLDVVGKTMWDLIEMAQQRTAAALEGKCDEVANLMGKRFDDAMAQLSTSHKKADGSAEKLAGVHDNLAKVLSFINTEIAGAFQAQDKKTTALEERIQELQTSMQAMQKLLEQKTHEPPSGQLQPANNKALSTPNSAHSPYGQQDHRRQPSVAGYYGQAAHTGRDMHDNSNNNNNDNDDSGGASPQHAGHGGQGSYENGNGRQWGSRGIYAVRREAGRGGYGGTNPYHFATGGPYGGGYAGGYAYHYSPTTSDAHHGAAPGQGN